MRLPFQNSKISLRFKIALLFVMLVIVMMAIVTYIFTIREMNLRVDQVKLHMERLANNIATIRSVESGDDSFYQAYIENQLTINPDIVYIAIFNEFRDLKAHALNTKWIELPASSALSETETARIIWQLDQRQVANESQRDLESISVGIMIGEQNRGYVHVGFSLVEINDELRQNLITNLGLGFLFTAMAIIISLVMSQRIVNPLSRLTTAMAGIAKGDFNQKVRTESRDEIGNLAKTFNFMTTGLREKEEIEAFNRDLGFLLEAEKIYQMISTRIAGVVQAEEAYLFLRKDKQLCKICLVNTYPEKSSTDCLFTCSDGLHAFFKQNDLPKSREMMQDYPELLAHLDDLTDSKTPALICPILVMDDVIGMIYLNGRVSSDSYSPSEKQFLNTLVRQAGFALENVLLLQELTEQERMKQELAIAWEVQQSLLPAGVPDLPGMQLYGFCEPAHEIGGDYYDFFEIDSKRLGIAIADVTGKGASAAFYMAMVKGIMLSLTSIHTSPRKLLSDLNRRLFGIMDRRIFITMIYAVLDMERRTLTFSRAGHNSLIVKNVMNCEIESHVPKGIGLGLEKGELFDRTIDEKTILLDDNPCVVFYTDGITEALNADGEEFGEKRLMEILQNFKSTNAEELGKLVIQDVRTFADGQLQHDDITLVALSVV